MDPHNKENNHQHGHATRDTVLTPRVTINLSFEPASRSYTWTTDRNGLLSGK